MTTAADAYLALPRIVSNYLMMPSSDARPAASAGAYAAVLNVVCDALAKANVPFPPTAEHVELAGRKLLTASRYSQLRSAWKWVELATKEFFQSNPNDPVAELLVQWPPSPARANAKTPGERGGKSAHPMGIPICMIVEYTYHGDVDKAAGVTYDYMDRVLGCTAPKENHDALAKALVALRHWSRGDTNVAPSSDLVFFDPTTKQPMTADDLEKIVKMEGLTLAKLRKGYFSNTVVWSPKDDPEHYVGTTFQFEVLAAKGMVPKVMHIESEHGKWDKTTGIYAKEVTASPYIELPKGGLHLANGETVNQAVLDFWKDHWEFKCSCHGKPAVEKPAGVKWLDEKVGQDDLTRTMAMVDFIGTGRMSELFGSGEKPREPSAPLVFAKGQAPVDSLLPVPIADGRPLTRHDAKHERCRRCGNFFAKDCMINPDPGACRFFSAVAGNVAALPPGVAAGSGALQAAKHAGPAGGRCADCANSGDPDCTEDLLAGGNGCAFFVSRDEAGSEQ